MSIVALVYFQRQVPETKNRSLQEIERELGLPKGEMADDSAADSTAGQRRASVSPPAGA